MAIKTIDLDMLGAQTGNIYESVSILSKRARQVSTKIKADLDDKLMMYEGFEPELEDPKFQEEQARISIAYEVAPEPTEVAINEMVEGDVYFREATEIEETLGGLR